MSDTAEVVDSYEQREQRRLDLAEREVVVREKTIAVLRAEADTYREHLQLQAQREERRQKVDEERHAEWQAHRDEWRAALDAEQAALNRIIELLEALNRIIELLEARI